jgi:WD40 repeat protein
MRHLVFDRSGNRALGNDGDELLLWDADNGRILRSIKEKEPCAFVGDGARAVNLAAPDGRIRVRDLQSGAVLREVNVGTLASHGVVSPDGSRLTLVLPPNAIRTLTLPDLEEVGAVDGAHRKYALSLAYNPDGRLLASGGDDGEVTLRDARTLRKVFSLPRQPSRVTGCVFSPDGKHLLARANDSPLALHHLDLIRTQLADIGLDWDDTRP